MNKSTPNISGAQQEFKWRPKRSKWMHVTKLKKKTLIKYVLSSNLPKWNS